MKQLTILDVWLGGHVMEEYPCDICSVTGEMESNAGAEYRVEYDGKSYTFTLYDLIHHPHSPAEVQEEGEA